LTKKKFEFTSIISSIVIISPYALLFIILLHIIYKPYLDNDVSQYLTAGQMMLNGSIPYKDLVDTNLPMIIYLSCLPALISKLLNFPLAWSGILFFLIIYLGAGFLIIRLLKIIFTDFKKFEIILLVMVWLINLLIVCEHNQFGQRELIIIAFFIPYLLLRFSRYINVNISKHLVFLIAFLSFIALSIKPHYMFLYLLLEILLILSYGFKLKIILNFELKLLTFLLFIYSIHFFLIPGMSSFYNYWIGIISEGYPAYNNSFSDIFSHFIQKWGIGLLFTIFTMFFITIKSSKYFYLAGCFGWMAFFTILLYFIQTKGWPYHLLPFFLSIFLAFFFLIIGFIKRTKKRKLVFLSIPIILIFLYSLHSFSNLFLETELKNPFSFPKNEFSETIVTLTEIDDKIIFLDTSVFPGFPAITLTERLNGSRFLTTFPIAFIFRNSKDYIVAEKWKSFENDFYNMLLTDISQNKPKLIFINTSDSPQATSKNFQISKYLEIRGFYNFLASEYIKTLSVKNFDVYIRI
jgi:hypothetical protein